MSAQEPERSPSATRAGLALPASITFGSLVIAAALYAGLRAGARPADVADPTRRAMASSVGAERVSAQAAGATAAGSPPSPSSVAEAHRRSESDAQKALEASRARFVDQCWKPAAAKRPTPARATFRFAIAITASGQELGRAINEEKIGERPEVANCLRLLGAPITLAPTGSPQTVNLTMTLP